ncbi:MAG: flagellar hook protein FlgE [Gammaproteobacteria bacterium]|nr:flagellar hook protein FlgE [Gammaproteobacteria bacterium]
MSIFDISLTGLYAAQSRLRTTANNIANVNTPGFKRARVDVVDNGQSFAAQGGARVAAVSSQYAQGQLDFTANSLDLAITGPGFFRLNDNGNAVYSRAGTFQLDGQGYLVNSSAMRLSAFQVDAAGNPTSQIGDVQIRATASAPQATTQVTLNANLDATATSPAAAFNAGNPASYNFQTTTTVQDSLGANHQLDVYYTKNAATNSWDVYTAVDGNTQPGVTTIQFDSAGKLTAPATGNISLPTVTPATGAAPMNIALNVGAVTQLAAPSSVSTIAQDGSRGGASLSGVAIDNQGNIMARYADGQVTNVGRVAMANFPNPQDLLLLGGGVVAASAGSGAAVYGGAGDGGLGEIQGGALESSNVNLEEELVNLLQAKQAYMANAKVIRTESQTLGTLFKAMA